MTRAETGAPSQAGLVLVNTLPAALAHFESELLDSFGRSHELSVEVAHIDGEARVAVWRKFLRYVRAILRLRSDERRILVAWPLVGWFDLVLWSIRRRPTSIIMHDPVPLTAQVGMGRWAARLGAVALAINPSLELVVLSQEAEDEVCAALGGGRRVVTLAHPLLRPHVEKRAASGDRTRILVLGQFKPARDLDLLLSLGPLLAERGLEARIAGRGWPETAGWTVREGFLSEDEFAEELSRADVVLVPYRHYFQSGVAIRAIEMGVPVVGAPTGFLRGLLGDQSPLFVTGDAPEDWVDAVDRAISVGFGGRIDDVVERVAEQWVGFARQQA